MNKEILKKLFFQIISKILLLRSNLFKFCEGCKNLHTYIIIYLKGFY